MSSGNRLDGLSNAMHNARAFQGRVFYAKQEYVGSPVNHARVDQVEQVIRGATGVFMTNEEFETASSMIERARAWKE